MKRRHAVKAIAVTALSPPLFFAGESIYSKNRQKNRDFEGTEYFESKWQHWPNLDWIGPEYWGNRLQDWKIRDGKAVCVVSARNRTLYSLVSELNPSREGFETQVTLHGLQPTADDGSGSYVGFRLGAKGKFEDYRSAAVFGQGLDCGVTGTGKLFIGDQESDAAVDRVSSVTLNLKATAGDSGYTIHMVALDEVAGNRLAEMKVHGIEGSALVGSIALVSHVTEDKEDISRSSAEFSNWTMSGKKIDFYPERVFGPVCFAHYTLHKGTVKLAAQLAPIENFVNHEVYLQIRSHGKWQTLQKGKIDRLGRVVHFRLENWNHREAVPYRVCVDLPFNSGNETFHYEGTIAREPVDKENVKMAVFSCNADYGFPDQEVADNSLKHQPDLAVFLGDQFYESTGGFGIEISPLERSSLDYLRKWYMFGWSYREIFRHIPSAFIPDDHDVYHGNVWGEAGKKAPTDKGWGYDAQDEGGYKMPPEWVNMVQLTQTGHLPDPYDKRPLRQGIGAYYTGWVYGGISMAILEDRKFKSAPKKILPEEAKVVNGFIQNREFDIKAYYDIEAQLLGEKQMEFLEHWAHDWDNGVEMKAVLSQTNFCTVATLPEGSIIDSIVPKLAIPEPGEYVTGDAPTADMDSNGWPQKGRDEALRIIRKSFALHIAGDQHLATVVHYGVEEFGDAGFAFAGPALNNLFPRRWWPPVSGNHHPIKDKPKYTGNFHDGFGNKITVHAVANPHQTGRQPALIYDRATGYGMVVFNKKDRTMTLECWPRYVDPLENPSGQYPGWPVTIAQEENYARKPVGYLPELEFKEMENPVLHVINESTGETEYSVRVRGKHHRPKVFRKETYTVKVADTVKGSEKILRGIALAQDHSEKLIV